MEEHAKAVNAGLGPLTYSIGSLNRGYAVGGHPFNTSTRRLGFL